MIIVEGTVRVPEGAMEEAFQAMAVMVRASREEAGCRRYACSTDILDPDVLRVIEHWEDRDALTHHFTLPHTAAFRAALARIRPTELEIKLYDAEPEALPL